MRRSKDKKRIPIPSRVPDFLSALAKRRTKGSKKISQGQVSEKLRFEGAHFSRIASGKLATGPTAIARASLFLKPSEACRLIEAYLLDEIEKIDFERARLAEEYQKRRGAPVRAKIQVRLS